MSGSISASTSIKSKITKVAGGGGLQVRLRFTLLICSVLLLGSVVLQAQLFGGPKKQDEATAPRNLTGNVFDRADKPVSGAIVYLKNTRSLAVITYIASEDGSYRFNNLSPNVDYEVRAELGGHKSLPKTLSSFDSRKQAHINLKLEK
jgi:hypothetical protein